MSIRDVNLYGCFEDWFLANIDADSARVLRERGAICGVPGLVYYSETTALFSAFQAEIQTTALEGYSIDLWEFARRWDARCMTMLANTLVWAAAEQLAHRFAGHWNSVQSRAQDEVESDAGEANEI